MARATTDAEWARRADALTVPPPAGWPADEVAAATATAHRLVDLSRRLVACGAVSSECTAPACPMGCGESEPAVCDLVWDLACAAIPSAAARGGEPVPALVEQLREALRTAGGAVFVCRRTLHSSHECLFGRARTGDDLCGRVLAIAHRLGGSAR